MAECASKIIEVNGFKDDVKLVRYNIFGFKDYVRLRRKNIKDDVR